MASRMPIWVQYGGSGVGSGVSVGAMVGTSVTVGSGAMVGAVVAAGGEVGCCLVASVREDCSDDAACGSVVSICTTSSGSSPDPHADRTIETMASAVGKRNERDVKRRLANKVRLACISRR